MDLRGLQTKYWKIVLFRRKTNSRVCNYMIHQSEDVIQEQALNQQEELGSDWQYKYCQVTKHTFYKESQ
jgi:hypothetical protein